MDCENCIHFCVCVFRDGTQINASCCAFYEQNERPHGEWRITFYGCECSVCKDTTLTIPMNFCPNCGANMRKEGEEK